MQYTNNGDFPKKPYKDKAFNAYVTWKSLSPFLKGSANAERSRNMGIDEETLELLIINNQAEFAEKYKVSPYTLSEWNKLIVEEDLLVEVRNQLTKFVPNVVLAMYRNAISQNRNAHKDRANFMKLVGAFEQKSVNKTPDNLADYMKKLVEKRKTAIQ